MELSQENLLKQKAELDELLRRVDALARVSELAYVAACKAEQLDMRETLTMLTAELRMAQGGLLKARALGGMIEGGGVTRGGGT